MTIDRLLETLRDLGPNPAVAGAFGDATYARVATMAQEYLHRRPLPEGAVVAIVDDFTPESIARCLALWARRCVVVPMTVRTPQGRMLATSQAEYVLRSGQLRPTGIRARNAPYSELRSRSAPGLVVRPTPQEPAVVFDVEALLHHLAQPGAVARTLAFHEFDRAAGHWELLDSLAHGGCLVVPRDRSPKALAEAIRDGRVERLPIEPGPLDLLAREYPAEFASIRQLSGPPGTERPGVGHQATLFGAFGVLRLRSEGDGWYRPEGAEVRVVAGELHVRSGAFVVGFLNGAAARDSDGWLPSGQAAEGDGTLFRLALAGGSLRAA